MISFDITVTGGMIGSRLAEDPEELGYALKALIEEAPDDLGKEIAKYNDEADCTTMAEFLRLLADQIEAASA